MRQCCIQSCLTRTFITDSVGSSPAPLHTCGPPVNRPNQWSFYSSMEEVDQLIEALNPRGHRESILKEALLQDRERLQQLLQSCVRSKYRHTGTSGNLPHLTSLRADSTTDTSVLFVQIIQSLPGLSQNAPLQLRL